jgi:hypothetical protein
MVWQLRQGIAVCEYRIANLCNAERDSGGAAAWIIGLMRSQTAG